MNESKEKYDDTKNNASTGTKSSNKDKKNTKTPQPSTKESSRTEDSSTTGGSSRAQSRKNKQMKRKRDDEDICSTKKADYVSDSDIHTSSSSSSSESESDSDYVPSTEESESPLESEEEMQPKTKRRKTFHIPREYLEDDEIESPVYAEEESSDDEYLGGGLRRDVKQSAQEKEEDEDEGLDDFLTKLVERLGKQVYCNAMERVDEEDGSREDEGSFLLFDRGETSPIYPQEGVIIKFERSDKNEDGKLPSEKSKTYNLRRQPPNFKDTLSPEDKERLEKVEKEIFELNQHKIPPRYKILLSPMSLGSKVRVLNHMDRLSCMSSYSPEYSKLTQWMDGVLSIPFDKEQKLPITLSSTNQEIEHYLTNVQTTMNNCIFGQAQAKQSILECVGKWITNPNSANRPLGFVGEKGTGKTTLAKYGIAQALGRPFCMISLGGESDAATFKGHDYTYEGSRWGRIADMLIQTQCMNPVIFFDELDKVSETRQGEEIIGMLMHLTDTTQNDKFTDKYFAGIDIDMSGCLFVFSYNHSYRINPILLDRIKEIQFDSFGKRDKIIISHNFLIPSICKNIGVLRERYEISDQTIEDLITRFASTEGGVRDLQKVLETLFDRLNLVQLPQNLDLQYKDVRPITENGKTQITTKIATQLLTGVPDNAPSISARMMYT